jgi:DNA-binding NarL/FixJ family response regulator
VLILSIYPEDPHGLARAEGGRRGLRHQGKRGRGAHRGGEEGRLRRALHQRDLAEKLAMRLTPEQERPPHERLSDREYRVMWLLASGKTLQQIAEEMRLSPSTVSTYRGRILKKLGLNTNVDLVHYAMKHRLIE